jgi:hypothetical protein
MLQVIVFWSVAGWVDDIHEMEMRADNYGDHKKR